MSPNASVTMLVTGYGPEVGPAERSPSIRATVGVLTACSDGGRPRTLQVYGPEPPVGGPRWRAPRRADRP